MGLENIVDSAGNIVDGFKKAASNLTKASLITAALIAGGASYTNTTYAAGDNTPQVVTTTQQTEMYKGIEYTPITNEKGETIYVPTIATPQNIIKIIEERKEIIQHNINVELDIKGKKPIEELTIDPNLEEKLTTYLFLAAKNNGNATPKTIEELKQLEEKLGDPIIITYDNLKIEEINGKTYLLPIKENKTRTPYEVGIKIEKPKKGPACDAEYAIVTEQNPKGKITVKTETKKRDLIYTEITERFIEKKGIKGLGKPIYIITKSPKPIKYRMIVHGCVIKDSNDPKKATTYFSAPIYRSYTPEYANNN